MKGEIVFSFLFFLPNRFDVVSANRPSNNWALDKYCMTFVETCNNESTRNKSIVLFKSFIFKQEINLITSANYYGKDII